MKIFTPKDERKSFIAYIYKRMKKAEGCDKLLQIQPVGNSLYL